MDVETRGHLQELVLLPCVFCVLNSDCELWYQVPLPPEPLVSLELWSLIFSLCCSQLSYSRFPSWSGNIHSVPFYVGNM